MSNKSSKLKDFSLGGFATCGACVFTNPLEVVKIRLQLQGELQQRGGGEKYYKGTLNAFYKIIKNEGLFSIQKGLVPALYYQFFMNGFRFGLDSFHTNQRNLFSTSIKICDG
jgi:solute carrier family 25, member 34/35